MGHVLGFKSVLKKKYTVVGKKVLFLRIRVSQFSTLTPKGQIEKDFADGVLVSEIVKHYFPQIVDLRNYNLARNLQERMSNWR